MNVVECPFAPLRLRTDAAKRFKRSDRLSAVIWKMLMVAERRFRRLNAPHLLAKVYAGVRYVDWTYPALVDRIALTDSEFADHLLSNSSGDRYPRAECRRLRL